ncbi:unnamed protein product [Periconia digitata]|uniref:Uncharacterized protein n=1 Tax=Periconia digitata TaxID=1303443 RepID=A0A9W4XCU2_9PLEO|nr:unnamed protein product [Periconia digitata]
MSHRPSPRVRHTMSLLELGFRSWSKAVQGWSFQFPRWRYQRMSNIPAVSETNST